MKEKQSNKLRTIDMAYIAIFAAIITIGAWVAIPTTVPFTMQTFAIFCSLGILGGKRGTLSIVVYILLGVVGLPVFSSFKGGVGHLFGVTGGYLIGFILTGLTYWLITKLLGDKTLIKILGMLLGLVVCYVFGTVWFMYLYAKTNSPMGIMSALGLCVFPFVIPDLVKLGIAIYLSKILPKHMKMK